ncbi:MAG: argininosuccinate synthase [Coriobacteriales bacterium]|jgi:argininosuccinate synthase|nr:argininosuccinate synthase [Coriobacteriales bacterium]
MAREKVVLAYSGGLDTSCCVKWLQDELDLDVICMAGDVGQERADLETVKQKALDLGAIKSYVVDMRKEFCEEYLDKCIYANGLYQDQYPLVSALSRPVIVKHLVRIAREHEAKYIAHGCTGKGNDQARFEIGVRALAPDIEILAPVREWELTTRESEMEWAAAHGVPVPVTKASPYSIDDNLWGRAIEAGVLEDPWNEPPEDIYTMTVAPEAAPEVPEYLEIEFYQGLPTQIDGKSGDLQEIIEKMNLIAGRNGYGRIDMVEDRLVGVKSHEIYECPGALAIIRAHQALEELCLERDLLRYKHNLEQNWAQYIYDAKWYAPLKHALDAFMRTPQRFVTGTVRMKFYKGTLTVVGRKSNYSLYDEGLATYGEGDSFERADAAGFIKLSGLPTKVWAQKQVTREHTI